MVLCDQNGPFVRHVVYGEWGNILRVVDTAIDGTAYAPVGAVGSCASNISLQPACFIVNAAPAVTHRGWQVINLTATGADTLYYYESDSEIVHQTADVTVIECIQDQDPVVLCDQNGPFVRHYTYGSFGNIAGSRDTTLAGAPYVVVGTVEACGGCENTVTYEQKCQYDPMTGAPNGAPMFVTTVFDCEGVQVSQVIRDIDGNIAAPTGILAPCGTSLSYQQQILCDANGARFIRHYVYAQTGVVLQASDTELDGVSTVSPVAPVDTCQQGEKTAVVLCDDTGVSFVRTFLLDNAGAVTSVVDSDIAGGAFVVTGVARICQRLEVEGVTVCMEAVANNVGNGYSIGDQIAHTRWYSFATGLPVLISETAVNTSLGGTDVVLPLVAADWDPCTEVCPFTFAREYLCQFDAVTGAQVGPAVVVTSAYDCQGIRVSQTITDGNLAPVTPVGILAPCHSKLSYLQQVLCDANGSFIRHYTYQQTGLVIDTNDTALDGTTAYVVNGAVSSCPLPTSAAITICDNNGQFIRTYSIAPDGTITGTEDSTLAGAPYVPVGVVRQCEAPDIEAQTSCLQANTAGAGYAIDDQITLTRWYSFATGSPVQIGESAINATQGGATVATPLTAADFDQCTDNPDECRSVQTYILCDTLAGVTTRFVRTVTYDCLGLPLASTNRTLDGVTVYTPVGVVGSCDSRDYEKISCACFTDANGTAFTRHYFVDLSNPTVAPLAIDLDEDNAPFTPVAPIAACTMATPTIEGATLTVASAATVTHTFAAQPQTVSVGNIGANILRLTVVTDPVSSGNQFYYVMPNGAANIDVGVGAKIVSVTVLNQGSGSSTVLINGTTPGGPQ